MLSADQSPPAPPDGPQPPPGETPPRLFFPDEPAVPAARPPVPGPPGQGAPAPGAPPPGMPPGALPPGMPPTGAPGNRGYQVPAPPRPGRPARPTGLARRELRQRALAAAVFGLLSLFALSAANLVGHPLYLVVFAIVVALLAIITGASASRAARRDGTARPRGSVAAVVLGAVALALALILSLAIVFAKQLTAYQNCLASAPAATAQQACAQQLMHSIDRQLDGRSS